MKDRVPLYPNRKKITYSDGRVEYATIEYADEPLEAGTVIGKAALLDDTVAGKLGLTEDNATVNNALSALWDNMPVITFVDAYTEKAKGSGDAADLAQARARLAGGSNNYYAVFAGGAMSSTKYNKADAYDANLTRTTPTPLNVARSGLCGIGIGGSILFAGGYSSSYTAIVDAYDENLTHSVIAELKTARYPVATNAGTYALFAGGAVVDAYDAKLTKTIPAQLSVTRSDLAAASVGKRAVFAGGRSGSSSYCATVDTYDENLTRSIVTDLSTARYELAGASSQGHALFAGGRSSSSSSGIRDIVDAYDRYLTRSTPSALAEARAGLTGGSDGGYGMFAGGTKGSDYSSIVDVYNENLTHTTKTGMPRLGMASAAINNIVLFAGGEYLNAEKTVKYFSLSYVLKITVPRFWAYNFNSNGEIIVEKDTLLGFASATKVNGYIRPAVKTYTGKIDLS